MIPPLFTPTSIDSHIIGALRLADSTMIGDRYRSLLVGYIATNSVLACVGRLNNGYAFEPVVAPDPECAPIPTSLFPTLPLLVKDNPPTPVNTFEGAFNVIPPSVAI